MLEDSLRCKYFAGVIFSYVVKSECSSISFSLPVGYPLGQIQGNSRCGSPLGRFGSPHPRTFDPVPSLPHTYIGYCTSGIVTLMRKAAVWCSQPLVTFWWCEGGGFGCLESIPWSCTQKCRFGGYIPPQSSLSLFPSSELPIWTGYLKIIRCPPYRLRPWSCGFLSGAHRLPFTGWFPQLKLPSWGGHIISQLIGTQKQWLPRILHRLVPQLLGVLDLVWNISSDQFSSGTWVWFLMYSW